MKKDRSLRFALETNDCGEDSDGHTTHRKLSIAWSRELLEEIVSMHGTEEGEKMKLCLAEAIHDEITSQLIKEMLDELHQMK